MAQQIGYGYGSEWHLLRMLGHHREYFYSQIKNCIPIKGVITWLDYPTAYNQDNSISGDSEFTNLKFLNEIDFCKNKLNKVLEDWKKFLPKNQNWDGIFYADNTIYLIEAKAHKNEISNNCRSKNIKEIRKHMNEIKKNYVTEESDWTKNGIYQLANRLSVAIFLNQHDIPTKLVNIYFLNGYKIKHKNGRKVQLYDVSKNINNQEVWEKIINKQYKSLKLNDEAKKLIHNIFIDCNIA